jgi:hypothetical protein
VVVVATLVVRVTAGPLVFAGVVDVVGGGLLLLQAGATSSAAATTATGAQAEAGHRGR